MRLFEEEPEVIEDIPIPEVPQEKPLPGKTRALLFGIITAIT
jgi:hypothetical protein